MLLDTLHDFDEGKRGRDFMESLKTGTPSPSSWSTMKKIYKRVIQMRRYTGLQIPNLENSIDKYLESYIQSGGNKALDLRVGITMQHLLDGTLNTVNLLNVRPLALKRIKNPSVTRVKLWAFYTIFSEYYKSFDLSIPPHVNKSIKFKGNVVGAKSFGLSADDVYKLCSEKQYGICIDAMDTSPRVPFTSKSLLNLTILTVAQIFDAASLTGGSVNLQRCYFNFTDVKNITNEYKIFNDMYTQCRIHELFGYSNSNIGEVLSSYDLCYQEKCEQIYMTFYYYILIPKAIRQGIQPQYDVLDLPLSYIDEMIFVMVPTTKRGQPNKSFLDKFNTKSMLTAQIITQKGLTKNPTFKQIGTSNKRHYHIINRYMLYYMIIEDWG